MLVEVVVLGGDEGLDQMRGQLVQGGDPPSVLVELSRWIAVAVENGAGQGRAIVLEHREIRKIAEKDEIEGKDTHYREDST